MKLTLRKQLTHVIDDIHIKMLKYFLIRFDNIELMKILHCDYCMYHNIKYIDHEINNVHKM